MQLTIKNKLTWVIGILLCLFGLFGLFSYLQILSINSKVREITEIEEPTRAAALEMEIPYKPAESAVIGPTGTRHEISP